MGCFFACFGLSKDAKRVKNRHKPRLRDQDSTIQRKPIPEPVLSSLHTFQDDSNKPLRSGSKAGNAHEMTLNISTTEELTSDSILSKKENIKGEENLAKASKPESSEDFAIPSSLGTWPPTDRYSNCRDSDDDDAVLDDYLATDENDKDDEFGKVESKRKIAGEGLNPSRSKRNARSRTAYMSPVLNPVENLSQWNAVKSKGKLPPTPQKENLKYEQDSTALCGPDPSVLKFSFSSKSKDEQVKKLNQEMAVDASLSNWLDSSETTPVNKTITVALDTSTPVSHEHRPNLGALAVEELEQLSPIRSPNEMHTFGKYESDAVNEKYHDSASSFKGIPNTTSKYREDNTVKWHSTPFETRLERALNRAVAKA